MPSPRFYLDRHWEVSGLCKESLHWIPEATLQDAILIIQITINIDDE